MKKLLVSVLAIASMVACMNDEIVSVQKGNPIAFDSFVENATRANVAEDPSTTTGTLYGFNVWGFMDETTGILFDGDEVTGGQGNYTYTNTQYWLPGHDYYFAALAPIDGNWELEPVTTNERGMLGAGVVSFTNVDGTEDLLYAAVALEDVSDNPGPVKFQFHHLLSKVKFTFENDFINPKNNIVVSNVKMTAPAAGTIDLAVENWRDNQNDWNPAAEDVTLAFGNAGEIAQGRTQETDHERFTIPASADEEYEVTFTVDLYMDKLLAETYDLTVNVKGIALEMGKAYNFKASIDAETLELDEIVFDVDEVVEWEEGGQIISNATDLQAALDAAPENATTVINLGADIVGNVTDVQKPGRQVVIDGHGYKYNGTIKVHSDSNYYDDAALTIKNLNFETSTASVNFIEALENGSERYSSNITVEDCTFTATGAAENTAVGVQVKATRGVTVKNCEATNMHSLIQAQSCDTGDVKVIDCIVNGKNGVAFKQVKSATVEGTTITAVAYGIRFDGNIDNYGITVKDNNVTAAQPFIVRKMTGKDNTITLDGTNTLTVSAASISTETQAYQIIITNGSDDEAYVKPTGTYTLTGADDFEVYPRDIYFPVASWDEFTAALAAGEPQIKLTADITYDANYQLQKSVILNLGGYSMTLPMINIHTKTTIKNGTINGKVYARKNSEIVFNKVTFSGAVADNLSTEGHLAIQGGCTSLYAKDCLFSPTSVSGSQTKPLSFEGGSTIMKFEGCEFKSSPYKKQVYFNSLSATAKLDFTNCNFNNKTPNIMFAAACPLTNLIMSGTTKLSSVTLETNRAKDAVTAEDLAYLRESLIANNSMSSVRLFYAGGSSEYIR